MVPKKGALEVFEDKTLPLPRLGVVLVVLVVWEVRGLLCRQPPRESVALGVLFCGLGQLLDDLAKVPFIRLPEDSPEMKYFRAQREKLGGSLPQRRRKSASLQIPPLSTFQRLLDATTVAEKIGIRIRQAEIRGQLSPIVRTAENPHFRRRHSA